MVKAFQVGKRYTAAGQVQEWLCEYVAKNGHALLTSGNKSCRAGKSGNWSIVLPKPRTGTGIIIRNPALGPNADMFCFGDNQTLDLSHWKKVGRDIIKVKWTECINDQDKAG